MRLIVCGGRGYLLSEDDATAIACTKLRYKGAHHDHETIARHARRTRRERAAMSKNIWGDTGWLIESRAPWSKGRALWLRVLIDSGSLIINWTEQSDEALRFSRERDALMFLYLHPQPNNMPVVTEHVWCDGPDLTQESDKTIKRLIDALRLALDVYVDKTHMMDARALLAELDKMQS